MWCYTDNDQITPIWIFHNDKYAERTKEIDCVYLRNFCEKLTWPSDLVNLTLSLQGTDCILESDEMAEKKMCEDSSIK